MVWSANNRTAATVACAHKKAGVGLQNPLWEVQGCSQSIVALDTTTNSKQAPSELLQVQQLWIPRQLKPSKGLKHLSQKALGESALGQQGAGMEQQQLGVLSASC